MPSVARVMWLMMSSVAPVNSAIIAAVSRWCLLV